MSRNMLYLVIGLLVAGVLVVGYLYYQESQSGIDIEIGEQGITIEGN
jgi:predicted negative regulator of RcsB-dependent stress response